jgi:Cellulase (glycosyl hydrolase family 5)
MRTQSSVLVLLAALPGLLLGCSSSDSADDQAPGGSAGVSSLGGAPATGGAASGTAGAAGTVFGGAGLGGASGAGTAGAGAGTAGAGTAGAGTAGAGTGGSTGAGGAGTAGTGAGGTKGTAGSGAGGTKGTAGSGAGGSGAGGSGAGGSAGMSGSTGTAGAGGSTATAACSFASGLNIAWVNFANDVPNPNLTTFNTIFKNAHDAGGRVIRWWFHTNGTVTPGYDAQGLTQKLPQTHIDGVKAILAAAHSNGVAVNISLWSFDMLQDNAGATYTNNQKLLEVDANRQAYIDNYLTPLVTALKGTPGLYSYEIFNEPEGMTQTGWATHRTTEAFVQKTVNWLAAAIHAADPNVLVTNGSQTFDYCSNISGKTNDYSDAALLAAGGKATGKLDFYEVHYYTQNGVSDSAFQHPASYWKLDKKLVMGEFFAADTDGVLKNNTYTYLYTNGYNGAWAWSYDADQVWPSMQVPMQNLLAAQPSITTCP